MDCVYTVREYMGNYGGFIMGYLERESIIGKRSEFFDGNVAFIEFNVRPEGNGYWCEYTISTIAGEMVALNRWAERFDNVHFAKAATIEKAIEKAGRFKSDVKCKVGTKDADVVIKALIKRGEKERSAMDVREEASA